MPPLRNLPLAKPVKTERTHEENQERAYIAASRRSDRSLEARVESARRASEIHKRRTGRSLRVTEADVLNEEMYEEEDDDLPMQYRRLTAHLHTQNAAFNHRLQAYLANQMGTRAMMMGGAGGNADLSPAAAQFFDPAALMPLQNMPFQNPMLPPQLMHRAAMTNYRQNPYPMPNQKPQLHGRSVSVADPQDLVQWQRQHMQQQQQQQHPQQQQQSRSAHGSPVDHRRMSMPIQPVFPHTTASPTINSPTTAASPNGTGHLAALQRSPAQSSTSSSNSIGRNNQFGFDLQGQPARSSTLPSSFAHSIGTTMPSPSDPLSMTLPLESQQLLAPTPVALDTVDPMYHPFAAKPAQPFYSYNPNGRAKQHPHQQQQHPPSSPPSKGLEQTLATDSILGGVTAPIDTSVVFSEDDLPSGMNDVSGSPFSSHGYAFDQNFTLGASRFSAGEHNSGQITPNTDNNDWTSFLDGGAFDEPQTA